MQATLEAIFIARAKGKPMIMKKKARVMTGRGFIGDRYASGKGSWNKGYPGNRQVTLISKESCEGTKFLPGETRRNLLTRGVEVNSLIGKYFTIGQVLFRGRKYCDPCNRIDNLVKKREFQKKFWERGGIIAEVFSDGTIQPGDPIELFEYNAENMKRFVEQHSLPCAVSMASQSVSDSLPVR